MFSLFKKEKKKIFVGMSGGVDSSVSAYLLKKDGYDVTGVFIRTWQPDWLPCTWTEDRESAMRVCAQLEIPFLECDAVEVYKSAVVDHMLAEYAACRTPNPDILCNQHVKFGAFLDFALAHGADTIATGHYAQNKFNINTEKWELCRGIDKTKDQSYFLWTLTQPRLQSVLFPIGHLEKKEVRKIAKRAGLHSADRKDSQGICFLGDINMREFLQKFYPKKKGVVLSSKGEEIGHHEGAMFYTLGERHGFMITEKSNNDKPLYIVEKDMSKNTLTVSSDQVQSFGKQKHCLERVSLVADEPPEAPEVQCQIRYHGELHTANMVGDNITFSEKVLIAPGQSIVIYQGEKCLGGGIIKNT